MDQHGRAVVGRARDRDLELARQKAELGMQGRPLPNELAVDPRILDLVGGDTPAYSSDVVLRMQFPLLWMPCISTDASSSRISGISSSLIQLNCMFWRVVKWAYPLSYTRAHVGQHA